MTNPGDKIPGVSLTTYSSNGYEFTSISGTIVLETWKDFGKQQESDHTGGKITIDIGEILTEGVPRVTEEHLNAYNFLVQNQEPVKKVILTHLLAQYPDLQEQYDYDAEDRIIMPDITGTDDLKKLIRLSAIHVLDVSKAGISYVGYEFECTWDEEHGLGFMMYKDRIVEMGGADTSCLAWIAEKDLDPERVNTEMEANYKLTEEKHGEANKPRKEKPWWKFW